LINVVLNGLDGEGVSGLAGSKANHSTRAARAIFPNAGIVNARRGDARAGPAKRPIHRQREGAVFSGHEGNRQRLAFLHGIVAASEFDVPRAGIRGFIVLDENRSMVEVRSIYVVE